MIDLLNVLHCVLADVLCSDPELNCCEWTSLLGAAAGQTPSCRWNWNDPKWRNSVPCTSRQD